MLAAKTYSLSRDEIVCLIQEKCARFDVPVAEVIRAYRHGGRVDFGRYSDVLGLVELLDDDDPLFAE